MRTWLTSSIVSVGFAAVLLIGLMNLPMHTSGHQALAVSAATPTLAPLKQTRAAKRLTQTPAPAPRGQLAPSLFAMLSYRVQRYYGYLRANWKYPLLRAALERFIVQHSPSDLPIKDGFIILPQFDEIWLPAVQISPNSVSSLPIVIVTVPTLNWTLTGGTFAFTWVDGTWWEQPLPYQGDAQIIAAYPVPALQTQQLVLVAESCSSCSATDEFADLWGWKNNEWQALWQMSGDGKYGLHGQVSFADDTLNTLYHRYSSWTREDDKSRIFHESNPGPHRYFVETWQRDGDGYKWIGTQTENSAYNTLVEFSYAVNHQDWSAAKRWVENEGVVDQARGLGYNSVGGLTGPSKNYAYLAHAGCSVFTIEQCDMWDVSNTQVGKAQRNFVVHLVRQGAEWFVSNIELRSK